MGTQISNLLKPKELSFEHLSNKKLAVDSFNVLYQFLTTIRQRDGAPLKDSQGNITSHLVGLFSRTTTLMEKNIKLMFVFDGKIPDLKQGERNRRKSIKEEAKKQYESAMEKEDVDLMKKYASRTSVLTQEMVSESKELIKYLGLPVIQAPSEGEAQASFLVKQGDAFAVVSQDIDSLMFGAPRLVKNLSISGKRKKANIISYKFVLPELIELQETLTSLELDQEQLIALCMLVGTDYNIGGIKGIGPKNALKLVKHYKKDFTTLFKEAKWKDYFEYSWETVYDVIKNMKTTQDYELSFKEINEDKLMELLVEKHDFTKERVESGLQKIYKTKKGKEQKGLGEFFK
jgi:flap endonuclease-1